MRECLADAGVATTVRHMRVSGERRMKAKARATRTIPTIIEFVTDPQLIGDPDLSPAQETFLRALYGLSPSEEQAAIFRECTGADYTTPRRYSEAAALCGRRSGKTRKLLSRIAIYEAVLGGHERHLARGERGVFLIVAQSFRAGKNLAFKAIEADLTGSPLLRSMVAEIRADEIDLTNGITIAVYPPSFRAFRGLTLVSLMADEIAFWNVEGVNPDREVLAAARPAMATIPGAKLIMASTPYAKRGALYEAVKAGWGQADSEVLVWKAPTALMNPSISRAYLERERRRDPEMFRREFEAEPSDSITTLFDSDAIDACVIPGRRELPPHPAFSYVAALDAAFRGDTFTFGLCHQEQGRVIFDVLTGWEGSKRQPVNLESIAQEIGRLCAEYRVSEVLGDQYCAQPIKEALARHGVRFQERAFSARFKAEIYHSLKHVLNQGTIELLDHPKSLRELGNIELRLTSGGNAQIGAPEIGGYHDDYATVIALAASEASVPALAPAGGSVEPDLDTYHSERPSLLGPNRALEMNRAAFRRRFRSLRGGSR